MAHRLMIDDAAGCVFVRYWDTVDMAELDAVRLEVEGAPGFRAGLNRLWDERDCVIDVTGAELTQLAERWRVNNALHGPRKVAYLVAHDVDWGFNRLFEARRGSDGISYELFTDYAAAKAWLGLAADTPDPRLLLPTPRR